MNSYASHGQLPAIDPRIRNLRQQQQAPRIQNNRSTSLLQRTKHQSKILPHLWLQDENKGANGSPAPRKSNIMRLDPITPIRASKIVKKSQPDKLSMQKAVYSFQISQGCQNKKVRKECEVLGNVMELTIFDGLQDDVQTNSSKIKNPASKSKDEDLEDFIVADIMGKLEQYEEMESSSNSSQSQDSQVEEDRTESQYQEPQEASANDTESVASSFQGYRFGKVLPPSKNLSQMRKARHLEEDDSDETDLDDSIILKAQKSNRTSTPTQAQTGRYSSPLSGFAQAPTKEPSMTPTGAHEIISKWNKGKGQPITVMEDIFRKNLKKRVDLQRKSGFVPNDKVQLNVCKQIKTMKIKLGAKPQKDDFHGNLDYQSQKKGYDRQQERHNIAHQLATKSKKIVQREYKIAIKDTIKEKYRASIILKDTKSEVQTDQ